MTSIDKIIKAKQEAAEQHRIVTLKNIKKHLLQEISDEEIKKSMREYNITDFGQMAAYITGAQWYREQLKQK